MFSKILHGIKYRPISDTTLGDNDFSASTCPISSWSSHRTLPWNFLGRTCCSLIFPPFGFLSISLKSPFSLIFSLSVSPFRTGLSGSLLEDLPSPSFLCWVGPITSSYHCASCSSWRLITLMNVYSSSFRAVQL